MLFDGVDVVLAAFDATTDIEAGRKQRLDVAKRAVHIRDGRC